MNLTKSILMILVYSILNYAQISTIRQITDFDFDSRNPVFLKYPSNVPWFSEESEIFFEAVYSDSLVSIYSIIYDAELDSFYNLTQISSNPISVSYIVNRDADGQYIPNYNGISYKMLLWETNENGNWDIAFSVDSGNGWNPHSLLFASSEDELDPTFVLDPYESNYTNFMEILYSRGNSVYLFTKSETEKNKLLFKGNDSVKYYDPAGSYSFNDGKLYVVAVEENNEEAPHLVYRSKNFQDTIWSNKQDVVDGSPAIRPKFTNPDYEIMLSFEDHFYGQGRILLIRPEDFGTTGSAFGLLDDTTAETSDFSAFTYSIITDKTNDDFYTFNPFAFKYRKNDSTFIRSGINESYINPYSDYFTKVINSKPAVGPLSMVYEGAISYTIWEDSSNNRINLFGIKRIDPIGIVDDNSNEEKGFGLAQNYPNPFNPSTKIQYAVSSRQIVILNVYDVLGNEIATLVNEEKPAGNYEVNFDARELTSGIYFYQLKAGKFVQTKKMLMLK